MIAAVSTIRNEGDLIAVTLEHLLAEGVSLIYLADGMSTDDTRSEVRAVQRRHLDQVFLLDDEEKYHYQPMWMNRLARMAAEAGAEWIVPFDADEFWYSPSGTIAEAIDAIPLDVVKLYARMFQHHDWDRKEPVAKPLCKVAYRWSLDAWIVEGNHEVQMVGQTRSDVLELRELQYRSFEHFCRKVQERNATIDPELGPGTGTHHKALDGLSVEGLREFWDAYLVRETVHDPIPVRHHPGVQPARSDLRVP